MLVEENKFKLDRINIDTEYHDLIKIFEEDKSIIYFIIMLIKLKVIQQ